MKITQLKTTTFRHVTLVALAALVIGGATACSGADQEPVQVDEAQAAAPERPSVVSAEAFVIPARQADLSFETTGQIVALEISEGDSVAEGQILARLNNESQQASLAQAQVNLESSLASLAQTKASATVEKIAQTQADLTRAEAALADLIAGPTPEEITEAEAKVETARANLAQVLAGNRNEDIQSAAANMLQAEANVREAQSDYDAFVYGDPDRLGVYGLALEEATLNYESAKAEYDKMVNGSTNEEIAISRAQLYEAETTLARTIAGPTAEAVAQAQADVTKTEAALAELLAGATAEEIAVAEVAVKSSQAAVKLAEVDLSKTELNAPFDGIVGKLNIEEGEMISAGVAALSVADTTPWQIETDDLNEIDVVAVKIGAPVQITVDALPNVSLAGKVSSITPQSEIKAGDVTYTVLIDITDGDTSQLRWGMTTFVDIEFEPEL